MSKPDTLPELQNSAPSLDSYPSSSTFRELSASYIQSEPDISLWSCIDILRGTPNSTPYAMIILNQPINMIDTFIRAWRASELHLCADGGANRLYDLWEGDEERRQRYLPDMIKGDLDSLRSNVKEYYQSKGVLILQDEDQYSTDLMKCISEVEAIEQKTNRKFCLLLVGGLSGRIDQTVHTMTLLYKLRKKRPHTYVWSGESLAWVLDEGSHLIEIDHETMGQTCGILPVGVEKAYVKTRHLKWNLDWETSFEGDVSSSNHLMPSEPMVYLKTDRPVLWCIEVKEGVKI